MEVSAAKISTIHKKHCRCWVRFTIDVWFVYEYIFYTVREDQVKCNYLFGRREGCGVWSSYEKNLSVRRDSVDTYTLRYRTSF
jgi:predicted HAD superfamily hydrolase